VERHRADPGGGATLVASDLETIDPDAPTLERGRTFRAGWSFRREEGRSQVHRLWAKLGLDPDTAAAVYLVLDAVARSPHPGQEAAWDRSLLFLTERMDDAIRTRAAAAGLAVLEDGHGRDPHTGFSTPASLDRWLAGSTTGTLALIPS